MAHADTTMSGRVLDIHTGTPIAGVAVSLADDIGRPVSGLSATSGADGRFTISGATAEEYHVRVDGSAVDYSPGWVGSGSVARGRWLTDTYPEAVVWPPSDLGDIVLFPAFFSGRFVDATTGAPVAGVTAEARDDATGTLAPRATAVTGVDGRFLLRDTPTTRATPTYHVDVSGRAVGYESGQVGVLPAHPLGRPVVPTGRAVSLGTGDLGDIVLDRGGGAAADDVWGFNSLTHTTVPPGTAIYGTLMRQISHDTPEAAGDRSRLVPIRVADQMCNNVTYLKTISVLDSAGHVIVVSPPPTGLAPRTPTTIPDGTPTGTYYLRVECFYGTDVSDFGVPPPRGAGLDLSDPAYVMPLGSNRVSVCTRFDVTAPGSAPGPAFNIGPPSGEMLTRSSPPLRRDACPVSSIAVVGRLTGVMTIGMARLIDRIRGRIVLPPIAPEESTTTTTTTTTTAPPAQSRWRRVACDTGRPSAAGACTRHDETCAEQRHAHELRKVRWFPSGERNRRRRRRDRQLHVELHQQER